MTNRLLIVNNVPTPYRTFMFNRLHQSGLNLGIAVEVVYQAEHLMEHKNWDVAAMHHLYPFWVSRRGRLDRRRPRPFFSPWTLNLDVVMAACSGRYRNLLFSPYLGVCCGVIAMLPKGNTKRVFWGESNLQSTRHTRGIAAWVKAQLAQTSNAIAVPGERAREYLHAMAPRLRNKPVLSLPNLVDPAVFGERVARLRAGRGALRESLGLSLDQTVILSVGRMEDCKGFAAAVQACLCAPKDFVYCLLGGGSRLEEYRRKAAACGASDHIRLHGEADEDTVVRYLAAADWFWHPALADASPLACIEALNAGLALAVSTQTGNAPETVQSGRNGFIFDASSPDAIADVLRAMRLTPVHRRAAMAAESYCIAHENFNPERVCERFLTELSKI